MLLRNTLPSRQTEIFSQPLDRTRTGQRRDGYQRRRPTFESAIKPLFRDSDRAAMLAVFDLWSFDDVRANAERILAAVRARA